jgi:hypothetical protein
VEIQSPLHVVTKSEQGASRILADFCWPTTWLLTFVLSFALAFMRQRLRFSATTCDFGTRQKYTPNLCSVSQSGMRHLSSPSVLP